MKRANQLKNHILWRGNRRNRDTKSIPCEIDTSCHPVQILIMRCDRLGISDTHRIGPALHTSQGFFTIYQPTIILYCTLYHKYTL